MGRNPDTNAEQRAETRRLLMRAGLELFADRGLERTTVDAIAANAGCSKGLVYHYFPNKRALAEAVLADWVEQVAAVAAGSDVVEAPDERLAAFARAMAAHIEANPDSYRLNLRALTDPELRELAGELTADRAGPDHPWADAFTLVGSESPDLDGRLFQASLLGIFAHHVLSPHPTPLADLVERLIELTLDR